MTALMVFAAAILVASIVPGPDFAIVTRNAMLGGRGSGMWTALGVAGGCVVWVVATAVGLSTLLAASVVAFTFVKVAGAIYLIYLGARSIHAAFKDRSKPVAEAEPTRRVTHWEAFRSGLLCNLLNPKALVFFTALIPQFISGGAPWAYVGELAFVAAAVNGLWFLALANLVGLLRRFLTRPNVRAWINGVTGGILVALGLRVAAN
ncbi:LysE family translocator [Glycomyces sp. L485]|uniref:LysE family translocator n=1 Tax=Glycomyces sp. L485 TaxID=2909235 RepID=UPI001F4A52B7|nr:LysE family translocator [Glycomyces sp. L485]MCH7232557.1 LysE family translocator [Glycomyces sp. L485]